MAVTPAQLRERAERDPASVDPESIGRALETNPGEADAIGDVLVTLVDARRDQKVTRAVADRLDHRDETVRVGAVSALQTRIEEDPDVATDVVAALADLLGDEYGVARTRAGRALRAAATQTQEVTPSVVDNLHHLLDPDNPDRLELGIDLVAIAVKSDPDTAEELFEPLLGTIHEIPEIETGVVPTDGTGGGAAGTPHDRFEMYARDVQFHRNRLASAAAQILATCPELIWDCSDAIFSVLREVEAGAVRAPLVEALGHAVEAESGGPASMIEPLGNCLESDDQGVAVNAAWALSVFAEFHDERVADVAVDHLDSLLELLAGDARARATSIGVLTYVCEHRLAAAERVTDALIERLDDDAAQVRAAAALALGYSDDDSVVPPLRELERSDPEETVRSTAANAIDRLDG
ncbi:HEAT repeat domain-containing protein [Halosimplex sp. TS25]|uniref:HEAT repeat domain-containing protein n=1 Tax=Halosimplex rarum TaxID=3396619 RepID=UPI0039EC181E